MEMTERRVASSEVVQVQLDSRRSQLLQLENRGIRVFHDHALGDLETQAGRIQPGIPQHPADSVDQIRLQKLSPGEVDVDRHRLDRRKLAMPCSMLQIPPGPIGWAAPVSSGLWPQSTTETRGA